MSMLPTDLPAPPSPRTFIRLTGCALLTSLTLACVPADEPHHLHDDGLAWDFEEEPLPEQPDPDILQPLPDDFHVPLLDEEFVVRLEWELMTDEHPIVASRAVDLDLVYCLTPYAESFDRPNNMGCTTWRTPTNYWAFGGDIFEVYAGENSTRHGIPEQIGHAMSPEDRTHIGVRYMCVCYTARATLEIYSF